MSSPSSANADLSFKDTMTQVWLLSGQYLQRTTADQVHQTSTYAPGQISERVNEPLRVIIDQACQRIEGSLNKVAERLEASLDEKFFAALRAASSDTECQEVLKPQPPSTAVMALYPANAAWPGSTAMSTAPGRSVGKEIQVQSAAQQPSNLDHRRQDSASVGQISPTPTPTHQRSVICQTTHEGAGERTTAASTHVTSHKKPPLSSMIDQSKLDEVMEQATMQVHRLQHDDTPHSWFEKAYQRKVNRKSWLHEVLIASGCGTFAPPKNVLVDIAGSSWFRGAAMGMVILSTIFSAYETDQQARMHLGETQERDPHWWFIVDLVFDIFFTLEMLVRLAAYRAWFFVDPDSWGWNLVDFFLVGVGIFSAATEGIKIYFIRVLRIVKVFRTARVVKGAKSFPQLRKLLYAVGASLSALFWAVVFLLMTMFVFSIMILSVVASQDDTLRDKPHTKDQARDQFDGIFSCFKTLFIIVCGSDWLDPHDSLSSFGLLYSAIMPVFVIFVNVGVMNVVVGVFAEAASNCRDRDLIAQDEIGATEDFIETMLELWRDLAEQHGESNWEHFKDYFHDESIQAYLASQQIDARHPHLLFELIDHRDPDGKVDVHEFVLGLLRCRGQARHLHSKVILEVLGAVVSDLECVRHGVRQITN